MNSSLIQDSLIFAQRFHFFSQSKSLKLIQSINKLIQPISIDFKSTRNAAADYSNQVELKTKWKKRKKKSMEIITIEYKGQSSTSPSPLISVGENKRKRAIELAISSIDSGVDMMDIYPLALGTSPILLPFSPLFFVHSRIYIYICSVYCMFLSVWYGFLYWAITTLSIKLSHWSLSWYQSSCWIAWISFKLLLFSQTDWIHRRVYLMGLAWSSHTLIQFNWLIELNWNWEIELK